MLIKNKKVAAPLLTKSKILDGLRCKKLLSTKLFQPELLPPLDKSTQSRFEEGKLVGQEARTRFPDGILITGTTYEQKLEQTSEALKSNTPAIFEASFLFDDIFVQVDILERLQSGYHLIEVKSSTKAKDVYIDDATIQLYTLLGAKIDVHRVSLMLINNKCAYPDLTELFKLEDVTETAHSRITDIENGITELKEALSLAEVIEQDIGPYCNSPYNCPLQTQCWAHIPSPSVFDYPNIGSKGWKYYYSGLRSATDIPVSELTEKRQRLYTVYLSGERYIDKAYIENELSKWKFPLSFLDFESVNYPIPCFDGVKPFEHVPFQFSCHFLPSPDAELEHYEFLHDKESDPRPNLIEALLKSVASTGSVVAYYSSFEASALKHLANYSPSTEHKEELLSIKDRLVDPLPVIRNGMYDPKFLGSYSIKDVAPALLGDKASYKEMTVGSGTDAIAGFTEMISSLTPEERKKELRRELLRYCEKDTMLMVELWVYLESGDN